MFELENFKDNIACITPSGEQVSYGELQALTARIISNLKPYQLVFSMCSNTIGSVAGYISFVNNNDATLMLDSHIERSAFDALYQTYLPRYVWAPKEFASPKGAENIFCEKDYILWEITPNESPVSDKLSVLLTTSGSTGSPKLVRLSKENLMSNALSIVEYQVCQCIIPLVSQSLILMS